MEFGWRYAHPRQLLISNYYACLIMTSVQRRLYYQSRLTGRVGDEANDYLVAG